MGRQSRIREGQRGARRAADFRPASLSEIPRRRNQPATQNATLPTKGRRHPQAAALAGLMVRSMSSAVAEPRMKPMVVPAAVELLIKPRILGEASSVV